jgi:transglutaminase-like putative cysteine protease
MSFPPQYIDLEQARQVLADLGVELSPRQIKRAADKDAHGQRKLPFFVDPIEGRLKIEKGTLVDIYRRLQVEAENNVRNND